MSTHSNVVRRYSLPERLNHWMVATTFILLALSGLALFHPSLFFLTELFGGGFWARMLHPFIGVVMFVSFLGLLLRFWHHNLLTAGDRKWLGKVGSFIRNHEEELPPVGRYNGGQKLLFWVMVVSMLTLLGSGIIIWQPYFAPGFAIDTVRIAVLLHSASAFVLVFGIFLHVYAAIWVQGTLDAMRKGTVSRAWARKHHPLWLEEVEGSARK